MNTPNKVSSLVTLLITLLITQQSIYAQTDWEVLFDGTSMDKWRGKTDPAFPANAWKYADGVLFLDGKGGDIMTKDTYGDFELEFEFNLTENANSGIKYFVGTIVNEETGTSVVNGPEYQIIDDYNYPEIKNDPNGLSSTGAAYLLYPPKNKQLNRHGGWNSGRIVAKGKKVEHWLNGVKVLSYTRGSKDYLKRKSATKFKNDANYGELKSGHILLTDHGDQVYFRNIRVRRF